MRQRWGPGTGRCIPGWHHTPVEEGVPEGVEFAEGLVWVNNKGVAWHGALRVPMHDGHEAVGGGLGSHAGAWHLLLQQVLDEAGLACAVLAGHQHHGLAVKVGVLQGGRVEGPEAVVLLKRQQFVPVQLLEGRGHRADGLGLLAPGPAPLQPAEHGCTRPAGLAGGDARGRGACRGTDSVDRNGLAEEEEEKEKKWQVEQCGQRRGESIDGGGQEVGAHGGGGGLFPLEEEEKEMNSGMVEEGSLVVEGHGMDRRKDAEAACIPSFMSSFISPSFPCFHHFTHFH